MSKDILKFTVQVSKESGVIILRSRKIFKGVYLEISSDDYEDNEVLGKITLWLVSPSTSFIDAGGNYTRISPDNGFNSIEEAKQYAIEYYMAWVTSILEDNELDRRFM